MGTTFQVNQKLLNWLSSNGHIFSTQPCISNKKYVSNIIYRTQNWNTFFWTKRVVGKGSNDLFPKCNIRSFNSRIKRYMYIHRSCKNKCMLFLGNSKLMFREAVKSKKLFFRLNGFPKNYFLWSYWISYQFFLTCEKKFNKDETFKTHMKKFHNINLISKENETQISLMNNLNTEWPSQSRRKIQVQKPVPWSSAIDKVV